ncbi:ABC transporter substrate-binding protein [Massilia sp. METH4]|uniref:ABC transporter substrate-binding protein n=1 Tax=Massilia sp. METH4 TaxID=3123041 RepID=UPI0030CBE706
MRRVRPAVSLSALLLSALSQNAHAQVVRVGVTVPTTGPAAVLGIGARNAIALFPKNIGGMPVEFMVVDDATDTTNSVKNAKMFLDQKVDLIVGSSTSPQSLAIVEAIGGSETPMIALGASARIVAPMDDKRRWVFKTAANDSLMASAIIKHMVDNRIKTVGFIGFADAYGESWLTEIKVLAAKSNIRLVSIERFNPKDASVTAQVLRVIASRPDAILVAGSGTPATMPHKALKDRGYTGKIYQTHGAATADFLRVGGKSINGGLLPVGPNLVWEQLPDGYPTKANNARFVPAYEAKYGAGSRSNFAAQAYDVLPILEHALPIAAKAGKPGTREFRAALRDAIEGIRNLATNTGVINMTHSDHSGLDERARLIVRIQDGKWVLDTVSAKR